MSEKEKDKPPRKLDPRQQEFLRYYLDPKSDTWANARKSAIKAGFSDEYADNITSLLPKWLRESLQDTGLIAKAIDNLSDFIGDDSNKNLKWDATKFTLTTLGKNKFSNKGEDAADKLADNITGMKIISDKDKNGDRVSDKKPKAVTSG